MRRAPDEWHDAPSERLRHGRLDRWFRGHRAGAGSGPGAAPGSGLTILGYAAGGLIVLACVPALRRWPPVEAVALACAAGLVVSPHAWVYDATLLLPTVAVVASRAAARGWPWRDRWLLAAAMR